MAKEKAREVLLGFEVGSGHPINIPIGHMVVTGMTQQAGKTSTLEALVSRSGIKAIAFITKRGEGSFSNSHLIPPYFREHADWVFVSNLIDATLSEKNKLLRSWLMKVCRGTKTLADVQKNVRSAKKTAKGFSESIYTEIEGYLELVVPEIAELPPSNGIKLSSGLNVMDLSPYSTALQALVIRSAVEHVYEKEKNTVVVIPEAWEIIPERRGSPAKGATEALIRKGGVLNNFMWADSLPGYEAILCRIDGVVSLRSFEAMFSEGNDFSVGKNGEDIRVFNKTIEVLSSSGTRFAWKNAKGILRHKWSGDLVSLNTVSGVVDVSGNHPVLKKCQRTWRYISADNFAVGDILSSRSFVVDEKSRRLAGKTSMFVGPNDLAWLYGFFAAEGWVTGNIVGISNKRLDPIKRAARVISEVFHLSACLNSPVRGVYSLNVRSPKLSDYFRELCYLPGDTFTSRTKTVPDSILNAEANIQSNWLDGYFEGDGTKRRGRIDGFTTVSRAMAIGVLYMKRDRTCSVQIRLDKPDVVQIMFSSKTRTQRGSLKKISRKEYSGYLYDLVDVNSDDHGYYAGVGNIRVSNSQDLAGVMKLALRAAPVYLIGVQREANEIKRTLSNIPDGVAKPKAKDVAVLELGQFYACWGRNVIKTYVQPVWMNDDDAKEIAQGKMSVDAAHGNLAISAWLPGSMDILENEPDDKPALIDIEKPQWSKLLDDMEQDAEDITYVKDFDMEMDRKVIENLTTQVERLVGLIENHAAFHDGAISTEKPSKTAEFSNGDYYKSSQQTVLDEDALFDRFVQRLSKNKALLKVAFTIPEIEIETSRPVVEMGDNLQGWTVMLISEGFFDKGANGQSAFDELHRRGKKLAKPNIYPVLRKLANLGALTIEKQGKSEIFIRNPDLKITRKEKK